MPCPTCDHTMGLLADESLRIHLCERCGTVKVSHFADTDDTPARVYVPKLVERCREYQRKWLPPTSGMAELWHRIGIEEAIHLPQDRRTT